MRIIKKIIASILFIISPLAILLLFQGCANQLPPGGGEEDKIPPKLTFQLPIPNSLNFQGNSIVLEFDEYVDRRSLQEAFHISPPVKGDVSFDWSGKEVEISFAKPLWKTEPNKTFVITINSSLTDIRGNALTSPITFAFSTGPKIDKSGISGFVFNKNEKPLTILAYRLGLTDSSYDPTKNLADYITETSSDGDYNLTNLTSGVLYSSLGQVEHSSIIFSRMNGTEGQLISDGWNNTQNHTSYFVNSDYFLFSAWVAQLFYVQKNIITYLCDWKFMISGNRWSILSL